MSKLHEKEKELKVSVLKNAILEKEVKILRKEDEIERIKTEIKNAKDKLAELQGV